MSPNTHLVPVSAIDEAGAVKIAVARMEESGQCWIVRKDSGVYYVVPGGDEGYSSLGPPINHQPGHLPSCPGCLCKSLGRHPHL